MENKDGNHHPMPEKKRKYIPPILMLSAGAAAAITAFHFSYEIKDFLLVVLLTMLVFFFIGSIIVFMLDRFDKQIEKALLDEGEVIEKEPEEEGSEASDGAYSQINPENTRSE